MNIQEIKNHIPHGYGKVIAERAGVTEKSVSNFLTGKTKSIKIEMAALEVLAELNTKKSALSEKIK